MLLRLLLVLILAVVPPAVGSAGEVAHVEVTIANGSGKPLRCLIVFAHWTTLDLPVIAPGGNGSVLVNRAADRALFIPRPQDGRPMMLEALHCGHDARWSQTLVKLGWTTPMLSDGRSFLLSCIGDDRLSCRWLAAPP